MKIKFVMAGLMALASTAVFAQKGELSKAKEEYEKYESLRGAGGALAANSLTNAKTAIDKAAAHEKTATLPQTYAVKAVVYAVLATKDSTATGATLLSTAEEALKKAKETDAKGENKSLIDNANQYLAQYHLNIGVKDYQSGKYETAYTEFDNFRQLMPDNKDAIYYTALAAANAGSKDPKYYALAIPHYTKLLDLGVKQDTMYYDLSNIYLNNKDTVNALKTAAAGIAKYPTSAQLRSREIEIALVTGKEAEATQKILDAIKNEPNNKLLYYYGGITYGKVAEMADKELKKTKVAATKAALQAKKNENYAKATEMYKKAVELDPNYADAALNLGFVIITPAIDTYNAANALPVSKQKEYDAMMAKANKLFDESKPYLDKAVALNPKSPEALLNLKTYYIGKKDMANANKVQKQIDALEGK